MTISLSKTVEMVANVLNASSWSIFRDGVTNGTTTLTSATAQFVSSMKGMTLAVSGAGGGGATLLTTITSVTNGTTIVMADAATSTATAHTISFGGRSEDPRHAEPEIIEAVLEADSEECREILADAMNPRRESFTETVTVVTKGGQLPSRTGAIGRVEIQHTDATWRTGLSAPLFKIQRWNQDTTSFPAATSVTDGYFDASTGNLEYTGTSARVSTVNFVKGTTPQSPDESQGNVVIRAARILFAKEGDSPEVSNLFNQIGIAGLAAAGRS